MKSDKISCKKMMNYTLIAATLMAALTIIFFYYLIELTMGETAIIVFMVYGLIILISLVGNIHDHIVYNNRWKYKK